MSDNPDTIPDDGDFTDGAVTVVIQNTTHRLTPTPAVALAVSERCEGLRPAVRGVMDMHLTTMGAVLAATLGGESRAWAEAIAGDGVATVHEPLVNFTTLLLQGGHKGGAEKNGEAPAPD